MRIGTCSLKLRGSVFSALSSAHWALNSLDKVCNQGCNETLSRVVMKHYLPFEALSFILKNALNLNSTFFLKFLLVNTFISRPVMYFLKSIIVGSIKVNSWSWIQFEVWVFRSRNLSKVLTREFQY